MRLLDLRTPYEKKKAMKREQKVAELTRDIYARNKQAASDQFDLAYVFQCHSEYRTKNQTLSCINFLYRMTKNAWICDCGQFIAFNECPHAMLMSSFEKEITSGAFDAFEWRKYHLTFDKVQGQANPPPLPGKPLPKVYIRGSEWYQIEHKMPHSEIVTALSGQKKVSSLMDVILPRALCNCIGNRTRGACKHMIAFWRGDHKLDAPVSATANKKLTVW